MLRLKEIRKKQGLSQQQLADKLGVTQATLSGWENEKYEIDNSSLLKCSNIFNTTVDYILGRTEETGKLNSPDITEDFTTFPVIGDVAAGYEHSATEDWNGDVIDIPNSYLCGRKKEDFFVLRIKGDSMYPIYHDGDKVLVLKQTTLNYSGQVGVVLYDDDKGTLKKVEYSQGEDWMRLVPINPNHPVVKIENEALEHCRILGVPRLLIREIND